MALAFVRILDFTVSSMSALFNGELDSNIGVANISITPVISSVSVPSIKSVSVDNEVLTFTFSPLFPNQQYKFRFFSTSSQSFQSSAGEVIFEDGKRNAFFAVSPGDESSAIREHMFGNVPGVVYETGERNVLRDLFNNEAISLQKAKDAIDTVKSGNYLSITVEDELKTRGNGPTDRLDNGGAFEILRVGNTPTGQSVATSFQFSSVRTNEFLVRSNSIVNSVVASMTSDPVSLQAVDVVNEKVTDDTQLSNHFDGLNIKVAKYPVIQVISVSLFRNNSYTEYNIERFGYTLKSNRYDTNAASINVNFDDNEIELSSSSITGESGGFLLPKAGDTIYVSYVYKRLGREVDSPQVSQVVSIVRETVDQLTTKFTLDHAPVVTSSDEIPSTGGVSFLNTQASGSSAPFTTDHPAFTRELPYDTSRFPAKPGEYTVNYNTGDVVVFGSDLNNYGTGEDAPVASYSYRKIFVSGLDYTFDSDTNEIAASSTRDLAGEEVKVSFNKDDTFADGTDYRSLSHIEVLNERINNKLVDSFKVQTSHMPITSVFRILNETTGELYTLSRFNDTSITFTGRDAPRQQSITRERVKFFRMPQETLLVSDELNNAPNLRIFKIDLSNEGLTDSSGKRVGANFNTSVSFSDEDIFLREFFYEDRLFISVTTNIDRLTVVGDYSIDYSNGVVYVAVSDTQSTDIGSISYECKKIETANKHILDVNNIYRNKNALQSNVKVYTAGTITDTTASITGLEQAGERFVNDSSARVLTVGSYQSGEDGITTNGSDKFVSNSAVFTSDDVGRTLNVGSSANTPVESVEIITRVSNQEVVVFPAFSNTGTRRVWQVLDLTEDADKTITLDNDIVSVKAIYSTTDLVTLPAASLTNYYDGETDSFSGNIITLDDDNDLEIGDAVIVDYDYGNVFIDYRYLKDEIVVSYEYGNNSIDWSISDALFTGDEYYVTYKYGALRDALLLNFGSLTQIPKLTTFSPNLNRETYRSVVGGTLQSFIKGPTVASIEKLVESFTGVTPNITETIFDNWILGRDKLHPGKPVYESQLFDLGKFDNGALLSDGNIQVPALSNLRLEEGTLETWIRPQWKGLDNDATITFDLAIDGYIDVDEVYIGSSGSNPSAVPFDLSVSDTSPSPSGQPTNIYDDIGYFIWYDEANDIWNIRWRAHSSDTKSFTGTITSSGEFYNVVKPVDADGYELNEITDYITSTKEKIAFTASIDGYDDVTDAYGVTSKSFAIDGVSFLSGDIHYLFDMADKPTANRMSIFKDGAGYLNFQIYDRSYNIGRSSGLYNVSKNINDWLQNELHHVAVSWKLNSPEEKDEMHLFVDGEEVYNLFKYGGNPVVSSSVDFGDVAEEQVITNSGRPIIGGSDGSSSSGSNIFQSASADFLGDGVGVNSSFYLLDETPDGTASPNFSTPYTITGVGTTSLTLDRALTTTLGNLNYSINQITATATTPVNIQDIAVVAVDAYGSETELRGVAAENPDYSIRRGSDDSHVIEINNGVSIGDNVIIRQLGLIFKKCDEKVYVYDESDKIRLNSAAPTSLADVNITATILDKKLIEYDGYDFEVVNVIEDAFIVQTLRATFDEDVFQPTNDTRGKKLKITMSGDMFDFTINRNNVIITGETYSGAKTETISFSSSGSKTTTEYWTLITNIVVNAVPIDLGVITGSIEIVEKVPITSPENNGNYAEVVQYANGIIKLEIYGAGGSEFNIREGFYRVEYPSYLRIRFDNMPSTFFLGSDYLGQNKLDGLLDEVRILDTTSQDTRIGEALVGTRSITTDYNKTEEFTNTSDTLCLLHFNDNATNSAVYRDRYDAGIEVVPSVNDDFGQALKIRENRPYIISNAGSIFNNNEGTIEFWISPLDDSRGDPNFHYYIDMSSFIEEETTSTSAVIISAKKRIREINSIRLLSDTTNTGKDYFTGGSISSSDSKTITLGTPLPLQNTPVKIIYAPLNTQGDRVSIFRDPNGRINFFMRASEVEHLITVPVSWDRHSWHRIMVMWKTNSVTNTDRLRLFVDGSEIGTIKYGTGLIYGTGVIYGQAEVRPGQNRFLVSNIDLLDTFSRIYIGSDIHRLNGARALLDNIRFSSVQRLKSIRNTSNDIIDTNYNSNTDVAVPVVRDLNTTAIYNFEFTEEDIEFLATVVNASRGIFKFKVEVIDSFNRVNGNDFLIGLLETLINTIKPAHSEAVITYDE